MDKLLIAFLVKTLNITAETAAELVYKKTDGSEELSTEIKDDALEILLAKDSERIKAVKPNTKEFFDNGFKKAEKEISERWEKSIREQFNVEEDVTGDELLKVAKAKVAKIEIEEDKVKMHPAYLALEKSMKESLKAKEKEFETRENERLAAENRKEVLRNTKESAKKLLDSLNPVLPKTKTVAENHINTFLSKLDGFDYEEGSEDPILLKEGKRVEDSHGHPVRLSAFISNEAPNYFELQVQAPKGNGGNGGDGGAGGSGGGGSFIAPKTEEEYNEAIFAADTAEMREQISKAWEASGKSGG